MVGHVQRNKAARVIRTFDMVESVDSIRLAGRLSEIVRAGRVGRRFRCSFRSMRPGRPPRAGLPSPEALDPLAEICALPG